MNEPLGKRDGGEAVDREAREAARLDLRDHGGELLSLIGLEPARTAAALADELYESTALGRVQSAELIAREYRQLGEREELEDRQAAQAGDTPDGAGQKA